MGVETIFREGVAQHQAGHLERAEACYQSVLAAQPVHADALHYLGLIAFQRGQFALAVAQIARAIELAPSPPAEFHVNLGNALKRAGFLDRAEAAYRAAVHSCPDLSAAWFNLALLLRASGDVLGAISALQSACHVPAPLSAAWVELGECHAAGGDDRSALACFEQIMPLLAARQAAPGLIGLGIRVGRALVGLARYEPAAKLLEQYRALCPDDIDLLNALGCAQAGLGRLSDAERNLARAHFLRPESVVAADNLACVLKDSGRVEAALAIYRAVLASPGADAGLWSNYLFTLLYSDQLKPEEVLAEYRRVGRSLSPPGSRALAADASARPHRPLRLGYLSGDFRNHPVAYFVAGIFRHHDPAKVDVHVYDNSAVGDSWTERLKALVPRWRSVRGLSDRQLAEQIKQDEIDVLIDLSGHTADNRLAAMALRPAKIQVTYLGYPFSTGVPWIDWRIVDSITDPPGTEDCASERLLRLPRSYYAYSPPDDAPEPSELPMQKNGYLTFGVCSNLAKVSPTTLKIWASLLHSFPQAHLFWRAKAFADPRVRRTMTNALQKFGIDHKRLKLAPWAAHADRWQAFHKIDVALDTYPYNQATNTCEALWMGVPTLSIVGAAHSSRMGASILTDAGLAEWVFGLDDCLNATPEWKLTIFPLLERDFLAGLRRTLRSRLLQSRLFDTAGAARDIEAACCTMFEASVNG